MTYQWKNEQWQQNGLKWCIWCRFGPTRWVFFFFFLFLLLYYFFFIVYIQYKNKKTSSNDEMGPNNMSGVVWATVEFFFLSSFYVTSYCIISFLVFTYDMKWEQENEQWQRNGPKWRQTCRLGPRWVFSFFSDTNYCIVSFLVFTYKIRKRKWVATMKWAQMKPDMCRKNPKAVVTHDDASKYRQNA